MTDRVDQLKEIVRYGVKLNVQVPRSVFNPKDPQFQDFQKALHELMEDPQLIVTIRERPPARIPLRPYSIETNYYNDLIIERRQYGDK